jgi:hypothetical protein
LYFGGDTLLTIVVIGIVDGNPTQALERRYGELGIILLVTRYLIL